MSPPHTVKSDRLLLEPLNLDKHLHECHEILSEPRIAEWSTRAPHTNLEQTKERILESMSSVQFRMWAIMIPTTSPTLTAVEDEGERKEMKMIGIIGISHTPANVGYKIHPDYWGKGYMTEALKLFVEMFWTLEGLSFLLSRCWNENDTMRAFSGGKEARANIRTEKKSFPQVVAAYNPGNYASARVLEKVGFKNGELKREEIELWFNRGQNRRSDIQIMYIDRPQSSE
ncbi:hypothetical protein NHQ30_009931 [Ciborinia camelliae]|nr:hypothetical protein NHQ30_009931 [Ciborinia camelliae]